jgi:alpha-tubulin suppressor-like RCC1 family protein
MPGSRSAVLTRLRNVPTCGWRGVVVVALLVGGSITVPERAHAAPAEVRTTIAGGASHSLMVKDDGTVWAWGGNYRGQLGPGVLQFEWPSTPVEVMSGGWSVASGALHSVVLKSDGSVWTFGDDIRGQLSTGADIFSETMSFTPSLVMTGARAVAAGDYHTVILKADGTVWTAGKNDYGQLGRAASPGESTLMQVMSGARAIAASGSHTVVLKSDGSA